MTSTVGGWLFGPGLPSTGVHATAAWRDEVLLVRYAEGELVSTNLTVEAAGFNQRQLKFSWPSTEGAYVFFVSDPSAAAVLRASAPEMLRAALGQPAQASSLLSKRLAVVAVAAVTLLLAIVVGGWLLLGVASAKLVEFIPPEQEAALGEMTLSQTRAQFKVHDSGVAVDAIRTIGTKLTEGSRFRYRWYVAESPELNAFAAPGGVVVVMSGLIRAADSPEELAGVLAHEVAHVELRHSTRAVIKSLGLRGLAAIVFGNFGASASDIAARLTELKFSRDAEAEADREGVRRLRQAKIDPLPMLTMFDKLAKHQASGVGQVPTFLSTHPNTGERTRELRAQLPSTETATATPLAIDWAAVEKSLP